MTTSLKIYDILFPKCRAMEDNLQSRLRKFDFCQIKMQQKYNTF